MAMQYAVGHRGDFHASIREVEKGLFRAEFTGEFNPGERDAREWPDYHLGDSLGSVKIWVENLAKSLDYRRVVWDSLPD